MISLYDKELWMSVFHIFMFALLVYSLIHKLWENSKTTLIIIVGFQIFGILLQHAPMGVIVLYLILMMCYLYYRAITKAKNTWSKYEVRCDANHR